MHTLPEHELLLVLLALAVILAVGRGTAELARRFNQPEVLGELLGGFLLGPSVFGSVCAPLYQKLFLNHEVGSALSAMSWLGAILLLLLAGIEAEVRILKDHIKPGSFAALFAMVPSILVGMAFASAVTGPMHGDGLFLGIVLSVSAVSVAAKILMERATIRRDYAQVILAAGIGSEVCVWLLISVVAAMQHGNALQAGLRSTLCVIGFFAFLLTIGKRFTFWAMRRVNDMTFVNHGQVSLVLLLAFLCAATTHALGVHALLGAFAFGFLLSQSPRANIRLKQKLETFAVSLFAPIFFVLAGMRVDISQMKTLSAVGAIVALFLAATVVKVGMAALGAKLGGLRRLESLLVGLGVNYKGGTDVIVAILGTELGLLSQQSYTSYAVVSMLTVLVTPPLMALLEKRAKPSPEEQARLDREQAKRRAYLSDVERVLTPVIPELLPSFPAKILHTIAHTKHEEEEIFDITQMMLEPGERQTSNDQHPHVQEARERLTEAAELTTVELTHQQMPENENVVDEILNAAQDYRVMAIGARKPKPTEAALSLGRLQDALIDRSSADVLVLVHDGSPTINRRVKRVLVPVNGMEYSLAAADVAAYIAKSYDAELVLMNVMPRTRNQSDGSDLHPELRVAGHNILREASFRIERLGVHAIERVSSSDDAGAEILRELQRNRYQLLVMGSLHRTSTGSGLFLGAQTQQVLTRSPVPVLLLVSHLVTDPHQERAA